MLRLHYGQLNFIQQPEIRCSIFVEFIGEVLQSGRIEDVEVWRVEAGEPFYNNVVFCCLLSAVGGPQFTYKILTVNNYNDKLLSPQR